MFHDEARGRSGPGFTRRLAKLIGGWLYFCGWRVVTLAAELFSLSRTMARLRRMRADKTRRQAGLDFRNGRERSP